ncbi:hypothetical protein [Bacillus sp. MZGC1]|uniref:hypothetical protein n=1 Tax=Bacillus sp. MZGC1 TaxID=2108543 RepID=UPI000D030152|nr:hypothetical protein [Bacillus sp. MZGC1]PRS47549.1 hypothetical protein C6Y06_18550 [Bacillus sp. MZGC1]
MRIKHKLQLNGLKRKTKNCITKVLDPLARLEMNLYNRRYNRTVDKITEDKAIKIFTKAITNQIVKYPSEHYFIIASFIDENYITGDCMGSFSFRIYFRNRRGQIAHSKFGKSIDFQLKVIESLKINRDLEVIETIEDFKWSKPKNYQKSVMIKIRGMR